MKLISWNVNGVRAILKKNFNSFLISEKPDVLGIQEIKISESALEKENISIPGYDVYWNSAERPGYSGTATLVREGLKPLSVKRGMGIKEFDSEGRLQVLEFEKFYFLNIYFPNANGELSRLPYKEGFNEEFIKFVKKLEKKKPVLACGDYNVAHMEIDLARPKENVGSPGFTEEERYWMTQFVKKDMVDTFRYFNGDKIQYSWWSYRGGARMRNVGWRIDYFLASKSFISKIKNAYILDRVLGSDHCPVGVELR
ncbi:MAG: exodeoxyribonuclease III [Patescibacteria group bacterium]|jgi:exodeoxyribonuclease-3|nr:exodeoxyribonuclease III [Patescibacteria group bacterium]